jgi:hypothetical protein
LFPAFDSGEDEAWISGPNEGFLDRRSATKRLMAALRSATDRKTPRIRRRRVSLAKKVSTALGQDADVGVKWNVQRGWQASHARA